MAVADSSNPDDRFPSMAGLLAALAIEERRSPGPAVLATVCAAVVAGAFGWGAQAESARCTGAAEHMHEVWDEAKREILRTSFLATGVGYAADTAARVQHDLDAYVNAWSGQHRAA